MRFEKQKSDTLDVLLPGSSGGMEHSLMKKLFDECTQQGHSVASFDYPYFERGEENYSGPELKEELNALLVALAKCEPEKYKHIRLIGKSLGGVVASYYLDSLPQTEKGRYSIVVFGYVVGSVKLKDFPGKIIIIQGEHDKFGSIDEVKKDLQSAVSKEISYFEIKGGDHSYRNPETKESEFEDEAVKSLISLNSQ